MGVAVDHGIVSCDDHMDMNVLPPRLFVDRLPASYRDRAPKVVATAEGDWWTAEGRSMYFSGLPREARFPDAISRAGIENNGFRPSTPELRLADMDLDGIYSQVIYGPPQGLRIQDVELKHACQQVFNDWAAEFNAVAPDRLCLLAYLPVHSPEAAVTELQRCVAMGHKGVLFSVFEAAKPVYDPAWEPLWSAVAEAGVPLSFHLVGGMWTISPKPRSWRMAAFSTVAPMNLDEALVAMVFSGALERHPAMQLVLGESGIGWVPYIIERMDLEHKKHGPLIRDYRLSAKPSELFARQVYATFEEESFGVRLIPQIGADRVMWASDYPHPDSTFPRSREAIEELFAGMDAALVRQVTCENAARLYGVRGAGASARPG